MLRQISAHVWVDPPGRGRGEIRPTVGVICSAAQTVLVDPCNSPNYARRLQSELERLGFPPIRLAIYTHHHWDHVFGACAFGVPVVAHALCRDLLSHQATKPWGEAFVRAEMERAPRLRVSYTALLRAMAGTWDGFHIVVPMRAFTGTEVLPLDDLRLELRHVGGAHAPDSIIVRVPGERVAFIGDCFYGAAASGGQRSSMRDSLAMLLSLLEEDMGTYIDGHTVRLRRTRWLTATLRLLLRVWN
jgi:glyoxylase-like metal-dependent hydrolase (beta-lactamase superfamily II)